MNDYRDDDQTIGYCPVCSQPLSALTVADKGYCELHGWVFANFAPALGMAGWGVQNADGEWRSDGHDTPEDAQRAALRYTPASIEKWAHDHDEYEYLRMEEKVDRAGEA